MSEKTLSAVCFAITVAAAVALIITGHDAGAVLGFASGPAVGALIAAFQGKRIAATEKKVDTVVKQTNGMLQLPLSLLAAGQAAAADQADMHEQNRIIAAGEVAHALRLRLAEDAAHQLNDIQPASGRHSGPAEP